MSTAREDSSLLTLVKPAPHRIGRYEICFELAAGGMATIYLARVEGPFDFKKLVALKCIHPHLVRQAGFVEMFLDEARLASRIGHPNVCTVFDFGFADSTYYIAMEFLVGETVGRLCRLSEQHKQLVPMPACAGYMARIVADAALGLHAAHELHGDDGAFLGLIHRDVSPQNIMVTYDGAVKVMDFGIAKTVDQLHLTRTGTVRGKFPYMAPEQVEQGELDRRTDVWSLGVVLWELLTGARLFHREREVDSIRAVLEAPIPAPSSLRPGVPKELDEVTLRALQRDPARRFASAHELALALEAGRGRRDATASSGALGEWLRATFPDLYARRLELVDQARQMDDGTVPRISRALSEPTLSTRPLPEPHATGAHGGARWKRPRWLALGASVLLTLGAGVWLAARHTPREQGRSRNAPAWADSPTPLGTQARAPGTAPPGKEAAVQTNAHVGAPASTLVTAQNSALAATPTTELGAARNPAPASTRAARIIVSQSDVASSSATSRGTIATPHRTASAPSQQAPLEPTPAEPSPQSTSPGVSHSLGLGVVNVATPGGWADVFVGNRHRGRTPLQLELPQGRRSLTLRPFGGKPVKREVLVRPNQVTRLVVPVHG
jgi:serine/threonine protein kinase